MRQSLTVPVQSATGGSGSGFDMTHSSVLSRGSAASLNSLNGTPAAQAYVGQLSFNQKPFNQMYQVLTNRSGTCLW